jgi:hypothetical protein
MREFENSYIARCPPSLELGLDVLFSVDEVSFITLMLYPMEGFLFLAITGWTYPI